MDFKFSFRYRSCLKHLFEFFLKAFSFGYNLFQTCLNKFNSFFLYFFLLLSGKEVYKLFSSRFRSPLQLCVFLLCKLFSFRYNTAFLCYISFYVFSFKVQKHSLLKVVFNLVYFSFRYRSPFYFFLILGTEVVFKAFTLRKLSNFMFTLGTEVFI